MRNWHGSITLRCDTETTWHAWLLARGAGCADANRGVRALPESGGLVGMTPVAIEQEKDVPRGLGTVPRHGAPAAVEEAGNST